MAITETTDTRQARSTGRVRAGLAARLADGQPAHAEARSLVFSLQIGGWSETEAGNLVALLLGIRPVASGWRATEIEHLRFLRALVETGRIEH
jgi:hypothetical protein